MASEELQHLKEIAVKLGLNHSPNISVETLKGKIKDFCTETGISLDDEVLEGIFTEQAEVVEQPPVEEVPVAKETKKEVNGLDLSKLTFAGVAKAHAEEAKQTAYKRAMKLIRCRIVCNNPNKRSYQGEIFCARNKIIPEVKKMVPFNTPTHVPAILLNVIKEKQLQTFISKRLPNGMETKTPKLVPEYNIEILPPLTTEEYNAIRQKQLAEGREDI